MNMIFSLEVLAAPGPSLSETRVTPVHVAKGGDWGVLFSGMANAVPKGGTRLLVALRDAEGAIATLDRGVRAPDGSLGAQVALKKDGPVAAFIPFRALGLPPGNHALSIQAALAGPGPRNDILSAWIDASKTNTTFTLKLQSCRPDRMEVSPGHDAQGLRQVEFKLDITAAPLRGRRGHILLRFKTREGRAIPCATAPHSTEGQLSTTAGFKMPQDDTILDGVRLAVPFDLFPNGTDECRVDIEFLDAQQTTLDSLRDVPIRIRD
jgi:hypothetical protein